MLSITLLNTLKTHFIFKHNFHNHILSISLYMLHIVHTAKTNFFSSKESQKPTCSVQDTSAIPNNVESRGYVKKILFCLNVLKTSKTSSSFFTILFIKQNFPSIRQELSFPFTLTLYF